MMGCDAKHRGAHAYAGIKRDDPVVRHFFAEPIHQVDLGADGPWRGGGGFRGPLKNAFGRADFVGCLRHIEAALRMHNYANARIRAANSVDVLWLEALMDGAVPLPQNHAGLANRFRGTAPKILIGIPNDHFVERDSHAKSGVPAKVLIRQKQDFFSTRESPAHHSAGIRADADGSAVLSGARLDGLG